MLNESSRQVGLYRRNVFFWKFYGPLGAQAFCLPFHRQFLRNARSRREGGAPRALMSSEASSSW